MSLKKPHMVDIETMSTTSNALVLSIGIVPFDTIANTQGKPWIGEPVLIVPDFMEQVLAGRHIDPSTQKWWSEQPENARLHWQLPERKLTVRSALAEAFDVLSEATEIWARGPQFDIVILETLARDFGMRVPWKYSIVRDSRTALNVIQQLPTQQAHRVFNSTDWLDPIAHHPVHDCVCEIRALWEHGISV